MNASNIGKSPETAVTPSSLNQLAKKTIENTISSIWLTGEVTDLYMAPSGHAYFSLKDHRSSVKCTFFKQYNFKKTKISNGEALLVLGLATLYEERGTFQLKVERVEKSGIGDMAKAFAELKIKLEALGYFSPEKKQKLPNRIQSLAIITSTSSAAIRDVLNVIKRRNPLLEITIYHASVQGEKAIEEIIEALLTADINQHDVILLTRGGGSEEDLWTFNDVSIAQTLFNLETPCVSAVGHERDTSISDLVADVTAITPSAAAELLTPDLNLLKLKLQHNLKSIDVLLKNKINALQQQLDLNYHRICQSHPKNKIEQTKQQLQYNVKKLMQIISEQLNNRKNQLSIINNNLSHIDFNIDNNKSDIALKTNKMIHRINKLYEHRLTQLKSCSEKLHVLSPLTTLSRGYSITRNHSDKSVITQIKQIKEGEQIENVFSNGTVISTVNTINKKSKFSSK